MKSEFDDQKLKSMVQDCPGLSYSRAPDVMNILDKDKLTDKDRNMLLDYIRLNPRYVQPESIKSMKQKIFDKIGYVGSTNMYGTVSRDEVRAIHDYIVLGTKKL